MILSPEQRQAIDHRYSERPARTVWANPMPRTRRIPHSKLRGAAMISDRAWSLIGEALGITKRELQIIHGVFDNLTEREVAARLSMAENTVHTHLNRLFKKLRITTRAELVLRIIEELITLTLAEAGVLPPICPRYQSGACRRHNASGSSQNA